MFILALFVPSAVAATWPQESDWIPFTEGGQPLIDVCADFAGNANWDIAGTTTDAAGFWYYDGVDYFFRMRVGGDPTQSPSSWTNFEWSIGFEVDFDVVNVKYDYSLLLDGGADTLTLNENTAGSDNFVQDDAEVILATYDGSPSVATPGVDPGLLHVGELDTPSSLCLGDDYFVSLWVPGAEFESLTGITDLTQVGVVFFDSTNGTWKDTAGCDGDT